MNIGFIGLGNVGAKLAGSLLRNGYSLMILDLDRSTAKVLLERGAQWAETPRDMATQCDLIITCLPNPLISATVLEAPDGLLAGLRPGTYWLEMSTTDAEEIKRLGALVTAAGGHPVDCPVSGGCHRAATGNISIFAGCERSTFEAVFPVLRSMGRRILHTGALGSASILKVVTNYLASVHLVGLGEALMTAKKAGMDLNTAYEAIRISSGNSFVHETESQLILNGSRDVNFTMDLVLKDMGLFNALAERHEVPLELGPLVQRMFLEAQTCFGERCLSPNIVKRLEQSCGCELLAPGFPAELVDDEPEELGYEIKWTDRCSAEKINL